MAALLLEMNATVTICHSRTKDLSEVCKEADILVATDGIPEMVKSSWIKKGSIIIDVGINRIERAGKKILVGDVDYKDCFEKCNKITPVPGGVGLTIACLLLNTLFLHLIHNSTNQHQTYLLFLSNFNLKAFSFIKPSASL